MRKYRIPVSGILTSMTFPSTIQNQIINFHNSHGLEKSWKSHWILSWLSRSGQITEYCLKWQNSLRCDEIVKTYKDLCYSTSFKHMYKAYIFPSLGFAMNCVCHGFFYIKIISKKLVCHTFSGLKWETSIPTDWQYCEDTKILLMTLEGT